MTLPRICGVLLFAVSGCWADFPASRFDQTSVTPDAVKGQPASLRSRTRITAEQVLAIGLPDLTEAVLPGAVDDDAGELVHRASAVWIARR